MNKHAIVDLSSLIWTFLLGGKDKEFGVEILTADGKTKLINSAAYGYESSVEFLLSALHQAEMQPHNVILVMEGKNSKEFRKAFLPTYKAGRDKLPEQYEQFNLAKNMVIDAFLKLGASVAWQDNGIEADDVIGYLAQNLDGEKVIISNDKDVAQLVDPVANIHHLRQGVFNVNPFGSFHPKLIPVYIALVGDAGDKIPGARGFGNTSFEKMLAIFGEECLPAMETLIQEKRLIELQEDLPEMKELQKIIDDAENVYLCYELAKLRTEKVNTLRFPLQWRVGMVKPRHMLSDERLQPYAGELRVISAENYDEMKEWARNLIRQSPFVSLDIETSTPPESDEWLERMDKSEDKTPVDVFGSTLTSLQLTFGPNLQYTVYLPHENSEEDGIRNLTIEQVRDFVDMIPREKMTVIHNCSFELPVCYMEWGQDWQDDPVYHGFLRNAVDTKIMSSYVDENQSAGLKAISERLLGYKQATYTEVTTKTYRESEWNGKGRVQASLPPGEGETDGTVTVQHKMNELSASDVLQYGADDTICTAAAAVHFRRVMEIERSWNVFMAIEQFPAYVTAKGFVDGVDFSLETMREMEVDDDLAFEKAKATLDAYLIKIGFDGTVCPVYTEMTPANIKEAYQIITGRELKTLVRTPSKLAKLIEEEAKGLAHEPQAFLIADAIKKDDLGYLNQLVATHFKGEPQLDLGSSKQMTHLLYDRLKLPINIVNEVTPLEKKHQPELDMALKKFRQYRLGKLTDLMPDEWALVRKKAKANDDAIDYAMAFDQEHLDEESRAALKAIGTMKKVMTRRSLFYKNYWSMVHWKDGKIHAQINQCATVTRRYSASTPNLQQLPKKGEGIKFRTAFRPHRKGAVVCSIDFTGQELRLAAERSQDKNMLACYIGDKLKDIHSITAAGAMRLKWGARVVMDAFAQYGPTLPQDQDGHYDLFITLRHLPKEEPMKKKADDLRKDSKNVNFAAQFGGQAVKLSETLIMPVADAQLFLDARNEMFPDVAEAAKKAEAKCKKLGYAETMLGVRRHLQDSITSDDNAVASRAARQAWNMEIQGSAAEQVKAAMTSLWRSGALHKYDVRFIAPIHDELVTSVAREHALEFIKVKHQCMTQPYANMQVPIMGSISIGPNFGDQIECGDWYIPEEINKALCQIFHEPMKEAA